MKTFFTLIGAIAAVIPSLPILVAVVDAWTWIVLGYPSITDWTVWKALAVGAYWLWAASLTSSIGKAAK